METRHALLIGVPHYEDPAFNEEQLEDAITADIAAMRAALRELEAYPTEQVDRPYRDGFVPADDYYRLLASADAVVWSAGSKVAEHQAFTPDPMHRAHPHLTVTSITPFGFPSFAITECSRSNSFGSYLLTSLVRWSRRK